MVSLQRLQRRRVGRANRGDLIADRTAEAAGQGRRRRPPLARLDPVRRRLRRQREQRSRLCRGARRRAGTRRRARARCDPGGRCRWRRRWRRGHAPLAGDRANGVGELLRGETPHLGAAEHVAAGRRLGLAPHRRHLVGARRHDGLDQVLDVVAVRHEVARQPIEQRRTPGLAVHLVDGADDAATQQALPDAVHQRAREAAQARVGEDRRGGRAAIGERLRSRRAGEAREEEARAGALVLRQVAAEHLERGLGREIRGQPIRVLQLPLVDEAVVTRRALEIDAEEHLRRVLRRLHPGCHRGAGLAPPVDAGQEALGIARRGRVDQCRDEPVVGHVLAQRSLQPRRDARAPRILREVGDAVLVAEQIVPERDPMLGVAIAVGEQRPHQAGALVDGRVVEERLQLFGGGQQAPQIEVDAAGEPGVVDQLGCCLAVAAQVIGDQAIGRCLPLGPDDVGNRRAIERERRHPRRRRRRS